MSIQHARPNEIVQVSLGTALANSKTTTFVKSDHLEWIRLVLPAGKEIPMHQAHGEVTVQCLEVASPSPPKAKRGSSYRNSYIAFK